MDGNGIKVTKEEFKKIRRERKLTQVELGRFLKKTTGTGSRELVQKIEAGIIQPKIYIIEAMKKYEQ